MILNKGTHYFAASRPYLQPAAGCKIGNLALKCSRHGAL